MRRRRQLRKIFAWSLLLCALILANMLVSEIAFARAGGGHGYSGGGGGGRSGGGGGEAELIWLLIRLIIYYPHIGIPLTIVIRVLAWKGYVKVEDT